MKPLSSGHEHNNRCSEQQRLKLRFFSCGYKRGVGTVFFTVFILKITLARVI